MTFDFSTWTRLAEGSDNWPLTWADDDHQYAMWGDGGGFNRNRGIDRTSFGVARIEGGHDDYVGVNVFGGYEGLCPSTFPGKSHGAPISLNGVLYTWVTVNTDHRGYGSFRLYRSSDKACTWTPLSVRFTAKPDSKAPQDDVAYGGFVQFGKDSTAAVDEYVYTIAVEPVEFGGVLFVHIPGRIMLIRAPASSIENRSAYEFFAGLDDTGRPTWSTDPALKQPIFEDEDGVGTFPQMVYIPDLNRFVYTNEHGDGVTNRSAQSLLTMAEGPNPWGPWRVIYRGLFTFPQQDHDTIFQWNFAPKWFRNGGRDFTIVFSGASIVENERTIDPANDSWNTVDGSFTIGTE